MKDEIRGCVYIKSDRYYVRVYFYESGKRKQKNFPTGVVVDNSTMRKAKRCEMAAQRVLADILSTFIVPGKASKEDKLNQFFASAVKEWMARQHGTKAPSNVAGYQYCVNDIFLFFSEIKPIRIADMTSTVVEDYLAWERLRRQDDYDGPYKRIVKYKDLSGVENTVMHRASIVRAVLNWLKRDGIVSTNVASKRDCHVTLPQVQQHTFCVLTPDEAEKLIEALREEPLWFRIAVLLALLLGLRRSEVIGLCEEDIDALARKLVVQRVVTQQGSAKEKKALTVKMKTKNSKSKCFELPEELLEYLEELKLENRKNEKQFGSSYDQTWKGYLFRDIDGKLIEPDVLTKRFSKFAEKIGDKKLRYHDLRHSCASILHANGVSLKTVQEILGHSQLSTTIMYTHLYSEEKTQALSYLSNRFLKSGQAHIEHSEHGKERNPKFDRKNDRIIQET